MGTGQLLAIRRFSLGRGITADLSLDERRFGVAAEVDSSEAKDGHSGYGDRMASIWARYWLRSAITLISPLRIEVPAG
jgi:hypothetical protein